MVFDYYKSFYSQRAGKYCPGVNALPLTEQSFKELTTSPRTAELCQKFQEGDSNAKLQLPAVCWMGTASKGLRRADQMIPTQFFMIDIDHVENPKDTFKAILADIHEDESLDLRLAHVTPSGRGLRLLFACTQDFTTVEEHIMWCDGILNFSNYGDFDTACKDLSRLSFIVPDNYILYQNALFEDNKKFPVCAPSAAVDKDARVLSPADKKAVLDSICPPADSNAKTKKNYYYRGTPIEEIVQRYIQYIGEPGDGERHNFYNRMVKDFRCILDNDKQALLQVLPRFGHTEEECISQINSICRSNTLSKLPKDFFYFLKDNGFYNGEVAQKRKVQMTEETEVPAYSIENMPEPPRVMRELLAVAPAEFKIPAIFSLQPILGTLTSYLRAKYPFDQDPHSTEFYSVITAPPSTGKSFVKRYVNLLLKDLLRRDKLADKRDAIYNNIKDKKADNKEAPDNPRVQKRVMEAKCSEVELLEKQENNKGHHMFTFCPEIDTWAKGVRAAGGNKDDILRVGWDNDFYGQQFKSTNSFKGRVQIYWNLLLTGTPLQMKKYLKTSENGLVSRIGFCDIVNQEFADASVWREHNKKELAVIDKFVAKCDDSCYTSRLTFDLDSLYDVSDEDFDSVVPWRYSFKPVKTVDMKWIMPTIKKFLGEQRSLASLEQNLARDSFRKRVAVRGFRMALICSEFYDKLDNAAKKVICKWIEWLMNIDIQNILSIWGEEYNTIFNETAGMTNYSQQNLYNDLPEEFTKEDLYTHAQRQGVRTPIRVITCRWKKEGVIKEEDEIYKKIIKK